ncbi:MAG TPA: family 10 glycosylhydrolase [Bacillales bacterium]|nr:family 10 glycosylhydrolase [Bacillales bacterium]
MGFRRQMKHGLSFVIMLALVLMALDSGSTSVQAALQNDYIQAENGETHVISAFNQLRGANQLLVYTPDYGESTGNNRWGVEVIVENNVITDIRNGPVDGTADAPIPDNGYVISGHGTAADWILANLHDNGKVEILRDVILDPVKKATMSITKIDPKPPYKFPGGRGVNELVLYTPDYVQDSTGTNQYGYEVIVKDGIVVATGGGNSVIPEDGLVLSGHGTAKNWLLMNTQVGAEVSIAREAMTVTVTIDASAYINVAKLAYEEAADSISVAEQKYLPVPIEKANETLGQAQHLLEEAEKAYENQQWEKTIALARKANQSSRSAYYYTIDSKVAESRGTWYRPVEDNPKEVEETLNQMQRAGINELYLETFYHGFTIYPSDSARENGIAEQNPKFSGWDPLQVFIEEAKKRGIQVHAWVDGLYIGNRVLGSPGPILTAHPDWNAVQRVHVGDKQPTPQKNNGYYWLDVTNLDARNYMLDLFQEMTGEYDLAGINLDYLRYPSPDNWRLTFNYSDAARSGFEAEYGVDPVAMNPENELWEVWRSWIAEAENNFVEDLYQTVKSANSQAVVSITPEPTEVEKISQWAASMDILIPQAYSYDAKGVKETISMQKEPLQGEGILTYGGIYSPYHHQGAYETVKQVEATREVALGTNLFTFAQVNSATIEALHQGPWRDSAVSPGVNPIEAVSKLLETVKADIHKVYVPRHAMKVSDANSIMNKVDRINRQIRHPLPWPSYQGIQNKLGEIQETIKLDKRKDDIEPIVADRLIEQLEDAKRIITYVETKKIR